MGYFHYQGLTADGDVVAGTAKATSETELVLALLQQGVIVENTDPALAFLDRLYLKLFCTSEVTRITRQMALLLENKINVLDCLELVREGTADAPVHAILLSIHRRVENGKTIAMAFAGFSEAFDTLYVSMLTAGELSGTLEESFSRLADYREQSEAALKKLRTALVYPLLVAGVSVGVVGVLVFYIVPIFASMYANFGAELPTLSKQVVAVSDMVRTYALPGAIGLAVIVAGLLSALTQPRVRLAWHRLLLQVPFVRTLAVKLVTMRFFRTFGSLLSCGVDIITAVQVAARSTGSLWAQELLLPVGEQLSTGQSVVDTMAAISFFPKPAVRLVAAGEKAGQLGPTLLRAADFYEKEATTAIATLVNLIEPIIIIFLGLLVALLLAAMYLPLFDLVGTVQ